MQCSLQMLSFINFRQAHWFLLSSILLRERKLMCVKSKIDSIYKVSWSHQITKVSLKTQNWITNFMSKCKCQRYVLKNEETILSNSSCAITLSFCTSTILISERRFLSRMKILQSSYYYLKSFSTQESGFRKDCSADIYRQVV